MNKNRILILVAVLALGAAAAFGQGKDGANFKFQPNTLVVSRSLYAGDANTVTPGQTLPPGCVMQTVSVPLIAGGNAKVKVRIHSMFATKETAHW